MNELRTSTRRWATLTGAVLAVAGLPVLAGLAPAYAGPAPACPASSLTVNAVQPVDAGVLKVARVAGQNAGQATNWEMKYDAWICNKTAFGYLLDNVTFEHYNGASLIRTVVKTPINSSSFLAGAANQVALLRDQTQYPYPLPTSIKATFKFRKAGTLEYANLVQTHAVADHVNPGPLGGYFFPAKQADLPAGHYWTQGRHAENSTFQRWAYDLGVERWTGSAWDSYKAGSDHTKKESANVWDRPVYAMSDGEIIGCNRGAADNEPRYVDGQATGPVSVGNVPGGNLLWVRYGDETMLYAHLKQFSIPSSLCPFSDDAEHKLASPTSDPASDAPYRIKAGQFLGRTGNSGNSTGGPHLHIHSFRGLPAIWGGSETGFDSDARPLRFVNVRTQARTSSNISSSLWNDLSSAALPNYGTRIEPNHCGFMPSSAAGKAEVVNAGVAGSCFLQMFNAMRQAGLRPVHIDVHGVGSSSNSTTVWRPADGTSWVMRAGMDAAGLQADHDNYVVGQGFRYLQLETYNEAGKVKYAVIFVKGQPGAAQYARAGQSAATFQADFNARTAEGWRPVNVSVAVVSGVRSFAALYEKANVGSFVSKANIPVSGYQTEFDAQAAAGRQLAYVDGHEVNGVPYLSAIWYGGLTGAYQASHNQTKAQILALEGSNLGVGRLARGMTEYSSGGSLLYAAVWRPAPQTSITSGMSGTTTSHSATFGFKSTTDTTSTFECKLDAGVWAACTSGKTYTNLSTGSHTLYVRARDRQGLRDATPATGTWTIS